MPEPIDIILLAYNRVDYLARMVDALEAHTVWPHRLTIVDNVSGPQTRRWLRDNAHRFHQIVWNRRNEHLAGHQRGIAATASELFVLSDADLLPHPPTAEGCWLTRLVRLAERHPDFGLLASRIDSDSIRTWDLQERPVVDGEIIEARTGVWLNLMRRSALRVPYMSDGITCYALGRAGYRVGIARDVFCTHLGDEDAAVHPDYLARKQAATRLGIVYPDYPEVEDLPRPPTLQEVASAAPVLAALEDLGVAAQDAVELSTRTWPPVAAVEPLVQSAVATEGPTAATWRHAGRPPLAPGGARAVVLAFDEHDHGLLDEAQARAGEWVVLLTPEPVPALADDWRIADERAGVHPVLQRLATVATRRRWREALGYSTVEHGDEWQAVMRAGCFGDESRRLYV
ncbi:MAG: glycosyltransferase, partial [Actinomycetota bacterium]|nr:glycosyltransferase [Actinomycetota bacterium]